MNTNKALYFIALGAFALGLSSQYHNGSFPSLHRVADNMGARLCQVSAQTEQVLAGILPNRSTPHMPSIDRDFAEQQTDLAQAQADLGREMATRQAELSREMSMRQAELSRAVAMRQADLDGLQVQLEHMQEALERAQLQRVRAMENSRVKLMSDATRHVVTICPQSGRRIRIEAGPAFARIQSDIAAVDVGDTF